MPEKEDQTRKAPPTFEELVATPMAEAEARVQLANLDIQAAQCRQEIAAAEAKMADIATIRAVILRRVLNPAEAPADGSGN